MLYYWAFHLVFHCLKKYPSRGFQSTTKYGPGNENLVLIVLDWLQSETLSYSKTCLKQPLKNRENKGLNGKW